MKFKRWIAILMAVVMVVSIVSPTAFAEGWGQDGAPIVVNGDAGDGGTSEPSECTCTAPCTAESRNEQCTVCTADYTQCKVGQSQPAEELALVVDWKPAKAYAAYGDSVNITVSGSLSGTTAESGTVAITLSDAEAALLTGLDNSSDFTLTDDDPSDGEKTLSFTVTAGKSFSKTLTASATATTDATQPTVFDVASKDVTATATSAEGSAAPMVQVSFNEGATAASTLTFVEKLPDADNPYGSVTENAGSVASLTVTYVDKDGKEMARQEKAPTFTLWYQVGDAGVVEADKENPPFGLTQLPKITTASAESIWTGSVSETNLPSKVLALEGDTVVEKNITWFLEPSYPENYYPNAGALVQITNENASQYPSGLKNGQWVFIAGETPYEDDDITITKKTSLSHNIYWADNGNAENKRPTLTNVSTLYELQFSLDGSSTYETLTEENMKSLGLTKMPTPETNVQTGIWSLHWNNTLPSKVTYSDSTGGGEPITRDVTWRYVPKDDLGGYAMVEVTEENADDYSSVQDQYGTYYVLETDLTFTARIYRGDNDNDLDLSDAFYEQFYLEAAYTGDQKRCYQISYVKAQGNLISNKGEEAVDPDILTVTITHLWRYNLDNTRINYSLKEGTVETPGGTAPENSADGQLDDITGLEEGDYFAISYDNSAVPSFSGVTDGVYSGGTLKLTLTGTRNFEAKKVWLDGLNDNEKDERPDAVMELWRYRVGEAYSTAALVRDQDGHPYTLTLTGTQDEETVTFSDLPKYDAEGHKYLYVVREYLEGDHASKYEQVFGVVGTDGSVSGDIVEGSETNKRAENNTWLYDGGTLSNRLKGTIPVSVTKEWEAASFQSAFGDVMVELRLQSRVKGSSDWENTEYTYEMTDFYAENLTVTHTGAYPQYDEQGQELEYRWVEEAVYQGGKVDDEGNYSGGTPVESNTDADGDTRTFTLKQNDRDIVYKSTVDATGTKITNSIANTIDYEVTKTFEGGWNAEKYQTSYTFALYRSTSGSELEKYATFTIDKNETNTKVEKVSSINDGATLTINQDKNNLWKVTISGLPEFDADGQQYEYLLMEVDGNLVDSTTTRDHDGNYQSIITNGPGNTNIILVRKAWVDESDVQHRLPVTITVYDKDTNEKITSTTLGGTNGNWYDLVNIGNNKTADDVYILETKVGETNVAPPMDEQGNITPPVYTNEAQNGQTPTAVPFETQYHNYEATYAKEDYTVDEGSTKTIPMFTVTNRRLGNINLTVTKNWVDGDGTARNALKEALDDAGLNLAVKLEFLNGNNNGDYTISYTGYGNDGAGDTVTISKGNATPIQDNNEENPQPVDAIQKLSLDPDNEPQTIYFWNLPKYDTNGASVRYTVKEIFVKEDGTEVSESELSAAGASEAYKDVAEAYQDYSSTLTAGPYNVGENHALDTQDFTLSNKLSATKDVSWYALWLDDFAYSEGTRPDIYLNIYARKHVTDADGNVSTTTELTIRDYRWTYDESEGSGSDDDYINEKTFWKCTIENLPKYDDLGYEIEYFAVMNSQVDAGDFDYLETAYASGRDTVGTTEIFGTAVEVTDPLLNPVENVAEDGEEKLYALQSGNTFVNRIADSIAFSGEKLWQNLPDSYPLVDLPTVTFTLKRSVDGDTAATDVATMTIDADDWEKLNVNGHYIFAFAHTGENEPASSVENVELPSGAEWLPRFDDHGRLYTYEITESIDWTGTAAGTAGTDASNSVFDLSSTGQTFTNSYNKEGSAQLSAKKYLTVAKGLEEYPAITMTLSRTYTKNNNETSEPETVETITWSAADVKAAVEQATASGTGEVTVDHVFTFDDLPTYAPNGSKYVYTITEDKKELGGYDTWAATGDVKADALKNGAGYKGKTEVRALTADNNTDIDASFLNAPDAPDQEKITLKGTKVWNDLDNAFGFRPESLTINLERCANAQSGQDNAIPWEEVKVSDTQIMWKKNGDNQWTYTITGLERYAETGMPWIYRVTETKPTHYTALNGGVATQQMQDAATGEVTMNNLTNSILTSTSFKKTWVNSDGETITEDILGSGIELKVGYQLQVRKSDGTTWQDAGAFFAANLGVDDSSGLKDRTYSGTIKAALGDPEWSKNQYGTNNSFKNLPRMIPDGMDSTITLEYRVVETEVSVYRKGETTPLLTQTYEVQEEGDNSYSYTVTSNPAGGNLFAPYYGSGKDSQSNSTKEHKNQLITQSLTVKKVWEDNDNEGYVTRPTTPESRYNWEVTFVVERSADQGNTWEEIPTGAEITLYGTNEQNEVSKTINDLPTYAIGDDGSLVTYQYRVRELQSETMTNDGEERQPINDGGTFHGSYTVSYSTDGLTVTNKLNTIELDAEKVWNDGNAANRPAVTLELKYQKEDGSYASFDTPAQVTLDGKADEDTTDFYYEVDSNDTNKWKAVWKNVPEVVPGSAVDNDNKTIYKIFEINPPTGYMVTSNEDGSTITNTPTVTPSVTKHWLGIDEATNVTVELRRHVEGGTDEPVGNPVELTAANNWHHTFASQPKYDDEGYEYTYSVVETLIDGEDAKTAATNGGYDIAYDGDAVTGFEVYNYKTGVLHVVKKWADAGDPDKRPDDLELTLERTTVANPTEDDWELVEGATYTWDKSPEGSCWKASFEELPMVDTATGKAYTYRVTEEKVEGYTPNALTVYDEDGNGIFLLRNVRSETIEIPVTKVWDDNNDNFGNRPGSITVELYRNGVATGKTLTLEPTMPENLLNFFTGGNAGWSGIFTGLPKFDSNGELITYTVKEIQTPGYETAITGNAEDGFTITNTAHGELEVSKTVKGDGGDSEKEFEFTVTLSDDTINVEDINSTYGEMTFVKGTATFKLKDGEKKIASDLPAGLGYTVTETDANTGAYVTTVTGETDGTIPAADTAVAAFTNTAETINIPVEKVWEDNDREYLRPAEITVKLLADGVDTGKTLKLSADNGWKGSFKDLDVMKDGQAITYTIEEAEVDGYRTTITGDAATGFVITNTYPTTPPPTPGDETVDVSGDKTWSDSDNQDGKRPESITIRLYANGVEVAHKVVTAADNWHWDFSDLPKYEDGKEIVYTITEDPVEGYTSTVNGYDVTNTYDAETVDVSGDKTWNDSDNQDGKRPESITIRLYANGVEVAHKVVTAADNWHWDFSDLPKYEDGQEIVYTITEDAIDGYTSTVSGSDVTNTYTPDKTTVSVTKSWQDKNDQAGKRPDSITVKLFANGVDTGKTLTLSKDNNWTASFGDLDVYKDGQRITYTIEEVTVDGYTTTISGDAVTGFVITNSITTDTTPPKEDPPSTSNPGTPSTGDTSHLNLWLALMAIAAAGMAGSVALLRRRRNDKD